MTGIKIEGNYTLWKGKIMDTLTTNERIIKRRTLMALVMLAVAIAMCATPAVAHAAASAGGGAGNLRSVSATNRASVLNSVCITIRPMNGVTSQVRSHGNNRHSSNRMVAVARTMNPSNRVTIDSRQITLNAGRQGHTAAANGAARNNVDARVEIGGAPGGGVQLHSAAQPGYHKGGHHRYSCIPIAPRAVDL